jgi:DNA-directed RNA polymerase specialized sigma24 family protein
VSTPPDDDDDSDRESDPPVDDDVKVEGDDPSAPPLDEKIVRRFLDSQRALDIAANAVRKIVPKQEVADVAVDGVCRAVKAMKTCPPRVEKVLPGWLAQIARRAAIRWLEKRNRRAKYEGDMPADAAAEDAYTGDAVETPDAGPRPFFEPSDAEETEGLIGPYLDRIVDERDRPILEILNAHAADEKPYAALAKERGMTEDALDAKMRRFRVKYGPRVRKRNRMLLLFRWGGALVGLGVAVAVVLYLLLHRSPDAPALPDPETRPLAPSATASAEAPPIANEMLARAQAMRTQALEQCKGSHWAECLRGLDAAKALDPAGDDTPEVQNARAMAEDLGTHMLPGQKP